MSRRTRWLVAALAAALASAVLAVPAQASGGRPQPVANLAAVPGDSPGEIVVTWDAHPNIAKDYRVSFKPIGGTFQPVRDAAWNAFTLDNTVTLTGLVIGDEYRVRVRARFTNSQSSAWGSSVSGFAAEEEPVVPEKLTTVDEAIPEGLRDHIDYPDTGPDIDVVTMQNSYRTPLSDYRSDWEYLVIVTDAENPTVRGSPVFYSVALQDDQDEDVPDWHDEIGVPNYDCGGPKRNISQVHIHNCFGPGWGLKSTFTVPSNGQYALQIRGASRRKPTRVQVYRYIEVVDDCVGELQTDCELVADGPAFHGALHVAGDNDWFLMPNLDPASRYEIVMAPYRSLDKAANPWINGIYDSNRQFLRQDGSVEHNRISGYAHHTSASSIDTADGSATTYFSPAYRSDYYVSVGTFGGLGDGLGHYRLTIRRVGPAS